MTSHPAAFFLHPGCVVNTQVPVPITWWPLLQPIRWRQDTFARRYAIVCEHFAAMITDNAVVAAQTRYDVVTLVYDAIVRLGHVVADHHQGLFARDLREYLDDRGYLISSPAGPP